MPDYITEPESRISSRFGRFSPSDIFPGRDLAAGLAVIAIAGQLVFAQATLLIVICCLAVGRISRWRPAWLFLPAAAGSCWLLVIGSRAAFTGYFAAGSIVLRHLAWQGPLLARLGRLPEIAGNWRHWLPGQVPLALIGAAAETALIGLFTRGARGGRYRPGGLVVARCWYLAATLRRGEVATGDGCCVGIDAVSGTRASITWRAAESGVLCTSGDQAAAAKTGRDLLLAGIAHRKAVISIDLTGTGAMSESIAAECAKAGAPLQNFAAGCAHYDPLAAAGTARAATLVMAMLHWGDAGHAERLSCASYLTAALSPPRGNGFAAVSALAGRAAGHAGQPGADDAALRVAAGQMAELRASPFWRLLAAGQEEINLEQVLAERRVVHFCLGEAARRPASMIARLVVADLVERLADRSDLGGCHDCLVWVNGCEVIEARQLGVLVSLGERTGTSVVLSTSDWTAAAELAAQVNLVAVRGNGPRCPAADHRTQAGVRAMLRGTMRPDVLSLWASQPQPGHLTDCVVVR